jgi:hypothetical protein
MESGAPRVKAIVATASSTNEAIPVDQRTRGSHESHDA